MLSTLQMIFWAIVAIGVLVTVHEFGHFWVARKLGVKVLRFSVGFGRPLWSRVAKDGVEYVIAAIPLGGYVKMVDEREQDAVDEADIPFAFNRQTLSVRSAIVFAGPLFNFLFAIVAYWAVFVYGEYDWKSYLGEVAAETPAAIVGLQSGDRILKINNKATPSWNRLNLTLIDVALDHADAELRVEDKDGYQRTVVLEASMMDVLRDGQAAMNKLGLLPARPSLPAEIDVVQENSAAQSAGLQRGDRILKANDQMIEEWESLRSIIKSHPDKEIDLLVERDGLQSLLVLRPAAHTTDTGIIGLAGLTPQVPENYGDEYRIYQSYGVLEAIPLAFSKTWDMTGLTLKGIWKMLTGQLSFRNIGGPITIAKISGETAQGGFSIYVGFLAMLSITLGVMNLLPIPVLDGGHLFYFLIEAVKGSAVSENFMLQTQKIGLLLIAFLMFLAIYVDLTRLFGIP